MAETEADQPSRYHSSSAPFRSSALIHTLSGVRNIIERANLLSFAALIPKHPFSLRGSADLAVARVLRGGAPDEKRYEREMRGGH